MNRIFRYSSCQFERSREHFNSYSLFFLCFFLISFFTSCAQSKKEITPKTYIAYKINKTIIIDGKASEEVWKKTKWSTPFIDIEGEKKPTYKTQVKMLWDDTFFYILATLEEPHVWANLTKKDTIIFHNNDFEIFIDPDGDASNYYELEINALNTVWDLFMTKPYRENNTVLNDWTLTGLKSAVNINGTLNNPKDIDKGWTIELAIPWKAYKKGYFDKNIPKDTFWRVNFSRVNWEYQMNNGDYERKKDNKGKLLHEYNWVWSPMGVVNMHEPEKWGYVYFSSKEVGKKEQFVIPNDEKIKWKLFELYRSQKLYFKNHQKWAIHLDSLGATNFKIDDKFIIPKLENHSFGWNISVKSPFSNKELIIKEDGEFKIK
ncbi:carbohydrate-binding family 9-like protein [uncultured Polaribacter sp.]|uniref:carbohydrate-binding family 9-like protein n=1 Tax=uncultured Polaribacter sp. TaxID=174711 RepID=UPI00262F8333|nr:carbohydrate-binding family 9-like protein [uncultured Polaribacter sp.]